MPFVRKAFLVPAFVFALGATFSLSPAINVAQAAGSDTKAASGVGQDFQDLVSALGGAFIPDLVIEYFQEEPEETALMAAIKKATAGDPDAQIAVGQAFLSGQGTKADPHQAWQWFQKAADQGDPRGQYWVGLLYSRNITIPQFRKQALFWLERSAAAGHPPGLEALALLLLRLEGPNDGVIAMLEQASLDGGEKAAAALASAKEQKMALDRAKAQASIREKARRQRLSNDSQKARMAEEDRLARELEEDRNEAEREELAKVAPALSNLLKNLQGGSGQNNTADQSVDLDAFVSDYVLAVNAGDVNALDALVHPASLACRNSQTQNYFDNVYAKDFANPIPDNRSATGRAIGPNEPLNFQALFRHPVRPTAELLLSFKTTDGSDLSYIRTLAKGPSGAYRLVIPCPTDEGLKILSGDSAGLQPAPAAQPKADVGQAPLLPSQPINLDTHRNNAQGQTGQPKPTINMTIKPSGQTTTSQNKPAIAALNLVGTPDQLDSLGQNFMDRLMTAIKKGDRGTMESLVHPKFQSCRTPETVAYYEFLFGRIMAINFNANPTVRVFEIAEEGALPYAGKFSYPVRPTHQVDIETKLPSKDPKVSVSQSETMELINQNGAWFYAPPCPEEAGLKELRAFGLIP